MRVVVLRMNHRNGRDLRLTTHVALTARALGCDGVILSGEKDDDIVDSIKKIVNRWGGEFEIVYEKSWRKVINNWDGDVVHLTMYGLPVQDKIKEIHKSKRDLLVIVGSGKVPGEVYQLPGWNISVTTQPHSEVAALAVFLDRLFKGKELDKKFENSEIKVIPQKKGKKTTS